MKKLLQNSLIKKAQKLPKLIFLQIKKKKLQEAYEYLFNFIGFKPLNFHLIIFKHFQF